MVAAFIHLQSLAVTPLRLGLLCWSPPQSQLTRSSTQRETCDHVRFAASRLNDKSDGFLDGLLPEHAIEVHEVDETAAGGPINAFKNLNAQALAAGEPMPVVIGGWTSGILDSLSSSEGRATTGRTVFISPSSTLSTIADRARYPNVARLTTHDGHMSPLRTKLIRDLGWTRIAIVYESVGANAAWATGLSELFLESHRNQSGSIVEPPAGQFRGTRLPAAWAMPSGADCVASASDLLAGLAAANVRIVQIAVSPTCAHHIYVATAKDWIQAETVYDHAYAAAWISDDDVLNADGEPLYDAFIGVEGTIGFGVNDGALCTHCSLRERYISLWAKSSSHDACRGVHTSMDWDGTRPYCDVDGNATQFGTYAANAVDTLILYARAADAIYRQGGDVVGRLADPDVLYAQMVSDSYEGCTGRVALSSNAERFGSLDEAGTLVNMRRQAYGMMMRAEDSHRRQLAIPLETIFVEWSAVGIASPFNMTIAGAENLTFPFRRSYHLRPDDGTLGDSLRFLLTYLLEEQTALFVFIITLAVLVLAMMACATWLWCSRRETIMSSKRIFAANDELARENARLEAYSQAMEIVDSRDGAVAEEVVSDEELAAESTAQKETNLEFRGGYTSFWFVDADRLRAMKTEDAAVQKNVFARILSAGKHNPHPTFLRRAEAAASEPAPANQLTEGGAESLNEAVAKPPGPPFQRLQGMDGMMHRIKIHRHKVYLRSSAIGERTEANDADESTPVEWHEVLAVSHCWLTGDDPDPNGEQTEKLLDYLCTDEHGQEIKYVWFDYWCLTQGKRTRAERIWFRHQLLHINQLYLGARVLILLDLQYLSRFWTQFEAWLAFQTCTSRGIEPARLPGHGAERCDILPVLNASSILAMALQTLWENKKPEEAYEVLRQDDVKVTNQSDKLIQLPKVRELSDEVRSTWERSGTRQRAPELQRQERVKFKPEAAMEPNRWSRLLDIARHKKQKLDAPASDKPSSRKGPIRLEANPNKVTQVTV